MNIEEIADQIPSLWDTLDSLTQRMDTLKNTLPVRGQYFNQILEATEVVRCCTCCVILPDEKCSCDCGGDPCQDATTLLLIAPDLMYRTDVTELPQPEMPSLMMGPITQDSAILWQVEVDGQLYPTQVGYQGSGGEVENWLYMEEYLEQNKETLGFTGEYLATEMASSNGLVIKNLSTVLKKVRFIPNKTYPNTFMQFSDNPAVSVDATTGIISFCLAAISPEVISCEGASSQVDMLGIWGNFDVYVNGERGLTNQPWNSLETLLFDHFQVEFKMLDENHFVISNQTPENIRMKFVGVGENQPFTAHDINSNPTLHIDNSIPEFLFCLAPQSNLISCDGATSEIYFPNFSGTWNIEIDGELHLTAGLYVAPYLRENFAHIFEANDDGFMGISNKDSLPHRFKLIPIEDDAYTSPSNNPSFMEHEDGSITFCLAPVSELSCLAEITTPVTLMNNHYAYQDSDILCVAYKVSNLDGGAEINFNTLEMSAQDCKDANMYFVPNALSLQLPNNISSSYYSLSRFLKNLFSDLRNDIGGELTAPELDQGATVKQTYLAIPNNSGLNYGAPNTIILKEAELYTGNILNTFGGVFTFTPTSFLDAQTQIYEHFKPILEASGYTVSYYNQTSSIFIPNWGFRLAKTTTVPINLVINNSADGANVSWDCGWTDWDMNYGYFKETDCINPVVTEEQFKQDFYLTLRPMDGTHVDPNSPFGYKQRSTRVEIMSYAEAGLTLPVNGVDWIQMNNAGQKIVIDSCFYNEPAPG